MRLLTNIPIPSLTSLKNSDRLLKISNFTFHPRKNETG